MIHISQIINRQATIDYWRKPTKEEIKFGHGAIHFRSFNFDKCFDENGNLKLKVRALDDGLIYQCTHSDRLVTRKAKLTKIAP